MPATCNAKFHKQAIPHIELALAKIAALPLVELLKQRRVLKAWTVRGTEGSRKDVISSHVDNLITILAQGPPSWLCQTRCAYKHTCRISQIVQEHALDTFTATDVINSHYQQAYTAAGLWTCRKCQDLSQASTASTKGTSLLCSLYSGYLVTQHNEVKFLDKS